MKLKTIIKKMPDGSQGFAVISVAPQRITLEEICNKASKGSTFSRHELKAAVEILAETIAEDMRRGNIVDLGPLGIFQPTAKSGMKPNADDFTWHDVKANVCFRPAKGLKQSAEQGVKRWMKGRKQQGQ